MTEYWLAVREQVRRVAMSVLPLLKDLIARPHKQTAVPVAMPFYFALYGFHLTSNLPVLVIPSGLRISNCVGLSNINDLAWRLIDACFA